MNCMYWYDPFTLWVVTPLLNALIVTLDESIGEIKVMNVCMFSVCVWVNVCFVCVCVFVCVWYTVGRISECRVFGDVPTAQTKPVMFCLKASQG